MSHADRRGLLIAGAPAGVGAALGQAKAPLVIGVLGANDRNSRGMSEFNDAMAALGWTLGTHYVLEERYAQGLVERLPALAQEIAARGPAVIVVSPSVAARAAAAAAPTTPVVLVAGDPLSTGLVTNLARPGGMITGISNVSSDVNQKVIEHFGDDSSGLPRRAAFYVDRILKGATKALGITVPPSAMARVTEVIE